MSIEAIVKYYNADKSRQIFEDYRQLHNRITKNKTFISIVPTTQLIVACNIFVKGSFCVRIPKINVSKKPTKPPNTR